MAHWQLPATAAFLFAMVLESAPGQQRLRGNLGGSGAYPDLSLADVPE